MSATSAHNDLWSALEAFDFDDSESTFPFSKRLARDNGWTQAFADRVIDEYRRFVFLASVAGHPITPSDEVDQAWHLHLTYTRSYWDELCANVLQHPLHHGPTKGGEDEQSKFDDWYGRTLESYEAFFGHPPPRDIWPSHVIRFGEAPSYRRVNGARHWIIAKPRVPAMQVSILPLAIVVIATGAASAITAVVFAVCFIVFLLLLPYIAKKRGWNPTESTDGDDRKSRWPGSGCAGCAGCGGCGGCGG